MADEYVVLGAIMQCSKGSNFRKINLPVSHGSYIKGVPILNAGDNTTKNISYFGVCQCSKCSDKIDVIDHEGNLRVGEKKCQVEPAEWQDTKEDNLIDGKPALTIKSNMVTKCGGLITFLTSGQ